MVQVTRPSKILITGPPCSGTTALVKLLHYLGYHTGFNSEVIDSYDKGLEFLNGERRRMLRRERQKGTDSSPRVIKRPIGPKGKRKIAAGADMILDRVRGFNWRIEHVVVTTRSFEDIIKSAKLNDWKLADGAFRNEREAERWVSYGFYALIHEIAQKEIPYSLLEFPRFVKDVEYCWRHLLLRHEHGFEDFKRVHEKVLDPKKVHVE